MSGENTPIERERINDYAGPRARAPQKATVRLPARFARAPASTSVNRKTVHPLLVTPPVLILKLMLTAPAIPIAVMMAVVGIGGDEDGLLTLVLGGDDSRDGAEHSA